MKLRSVVALAIGCLMAVCAVAQNTQPGNAAGRYGLQSWAINNQRVASQYNYFIDSAISQGAALGIYNFPAMTCQQALAFQGGRNVNPFNTNATVKIVDINSAQTETVALNSITISGGVCALSLATSNTHSVDSYVLRSGTCGLAEALNDLGAGGGEVVIDQKFYDDGCTQSTITGTTAAGIGQSNQYIHDISNGQDTWYVLRPTATTVLSASGSAPTVTITAGANSYYLNYEYIDVNGQQGLPNTETSQQTSAALPITEAVSATAPTGAVGWIPMITANGGSTATEIEVPVTSSVCTLAVKSTVKPACAIGATATIASQPSSTSKETSVSAGRSTWAYQPIQFNPGSPVSLGQFASSFLPFPQVSSVGTSADVDIAEVYIPAGYFNYLGKSVDVCFNVTGTGGSSGTFTLKLALANQLLQSAVTAAASTALSSSSQAFEEHGCFTLVTAATGSSGTFWASLTGTNNSNGTVAAMSDNNSAVTSSVDLTKGVWLTLTGRAGTAATTNVTVNGLTVRPTPGS